MALPWSWLFISNMKQSQLRRNKVWIFYALCFSTKHSRYTLLCNFALLKQKHYLYEYVCVSTDIRMYICILWKKHRSYCYQILRGIYHICLNHSTHLALAQFSPWPPSRFLRVICSSAWLPYEQPCHFISHSLLLVPGEVISNDGFDCIGKAVSYQRAALSACVRVRISQRNLSQGILSKLARVALYHGALL